MDRCNEVGGNDGDNSLRDRVELGGWAAAALRGTLRAIRIVFPMIPDNWQTFVDAHGIVGMLFELSDQIDQSGFGTILTILTPAQSIDEATNYWPRTGVAADGFGAV